MILVEGRIFCIFDFYEAETLLMKFVKITPVDGETILPENNVFVGEQYAS